MFSVMPEFDLPTLNSLDLLGMGFQQESNQMLAVEEEGLSVPLLLVHSSSASQEVPAVRVEHSTLSCPAEHCHHEFSSKRSLVRHFNLVHVPVITKYYCNLCSVVGVRKDHMNKHLSSQHAGQGRLVAVKEPNSQYVDPGQGSLKPVLPARYNPASVPSAKEELNLELSGNLVEIELLERKLAKLKGRNNEIKKILQCPEFTDSSADSNPAPVVAYSTGKRSAADTDNLAQAAKKSRRLSLLDTLAPGTWLDGDVIYDYLVLLAKKADRCLVLDACFIESVERKGVGLVSRWSEKEQPMACQLVFFPVTTGSHWRLIVAKPQRRMIVAYDSLLLDCSESLEAVRKIMTSVDNEIPWSSAHCKSVPVQKNTWDCGVFLVACAEALMMQLPFDFSQSEMNKKRAEIRRRLEAHYSS